LVDAYVIVVTYKPPTTLNGAYCDALLLPIGQFVKN